MKKHVVFLFIFVCSGLSSVPCSFLCAETGTGRGKAVAQENLPAALKGVEVKDYLVETEADPVGRIQRIEGTVVVLHKKTRVAYFAAPGDPVYMNDTFHTLDDSRCRIKFVTEDIVTMAANSVMSADEIVDDREDVKKKSTFTLLKGKAMFYVMRLFRHRSVDTSVRTKTAVMGVRGTKFGVEVVPGNPKAGRPGRILIADSSETGLQMLLAQNGGPGGDPAMTGTMPGFSSSFTRLIVFEGRVFGVRPDGKIVEVDAGNTAIFGEVETEVFGSTPEDVKAFLEAVGAEALLEKPGQGSGKGRRDESGLDRDVDEVVNKLQEDGFITDAEEEESPPIVTPR